MLNINELNIFGQTVREITADTGFVKQLSTGTVTSTPRIMLPGETIFSYEEVAEMPPYTKEQYDTKVAELVSRRYSADEESAIQRKFSNALLLCGKIAQLESPELNSFLTAFYDAGVKEDLQTLKAELEAMNPEKVMAEFRAYNAFAEQCKAEAKDPSLYVKSEINENNNGERKEI